LKIHTGVVATVTLNRPDVRNAFNDEVIAELTQAFTQLGQGPAGARHRAGGRRPGLLRRGRPELDAPHGRLHAAENLADAGQLAEMLRVIYTCPKPTVARMQGDVYAGGMGLVAACDMAVSVDSASYCLSEVKLGLYPATISPYVIRAMGPRAAHRYFLTAERFDAARHCASALSTRWWRLAQLDAKVAELTQGSGQRQPECGQSMQSPAAAGGGARH
jgi:methylglutaconyl-CoA hydratase